MFVLGEEDLACFFFHQQCRVGGERDLHGEGGDNEENAKGKGQEQRKTAFHGVASYGVLLHCMKKCGGVYAEFRLALAEGVWYDSRELDIDAGFVHR